MPKGKLQIEITFDLDANCKLNISAVEKSSGKYNHITITYGENRLSKDEITKIKEEFDNEELNRNNIEAKNRYMNICIDIKDKIDKKWRN